VNELIVSDTLQLSLSNDRTQMLPLQSKIISVLTINLTWSAWSVVPSGTV